MDFGKRVASAYQFVLDDLKAPNKRLISALTLLALEDIAYCKNIVEVINQQVLKVRFLSKFPQPLLHYFRHKFDFKIFSFFKRKFI